MLINRHNYEEFFILYMDNELDPAGRRMVEDFVQLHPDLKEELDILLQYKLVPDNQIVFDGKEELMKENGQPLISISNHEEWFSLYIDNELAPEQRKQVDVFVAANPSTRGTLELLQKTKLQLELVSFPDKSSLYRKEEKTRRILPVYWRAAAAILIIILGITGFLLVNRKPDTDQPEVAKAPTNLPAKTELPENKESLIPVNDQAQTIASNPINKSEVSEPAATPARPSEQTLAQQQQKNTPLSKQPGNNPVPESGKDEMTASNNLQPTNNLPKPVHNPNLINTQAPTDALASNIKENNIPQQVITNPVVTSANPQPSDIIQAAYSNNEPLEETEGKKNKNRGIFRKIARTFEKRTNIDPTDDNRLLVAGLSIKLK
jgi:hypothetical protein